MVLQHYYVPIILHSGLNTPRLCRSVYHISDHLTLLQIRHHQTDLPCNSSRQVYLPWPSLSCQLTVCLSIFFRHENAKLFVCQRKFCKNFNSVHPTHTRQCKLNQGGNGPETEKTKIVPRIPANIWVNGMFFCYRVELLIRNGNLDIKSMCCNSWSYLISTFYMDIVSSSSLQYKYIPPPGSAGAEECYHSSEERSNIKAKSVEDVPGVWGWLGWVSMVRVDIIINIQTSLNIHLRGRIQL